jgi:pyruvate-formate lyase-activating enzyme
LAKIAYTDDRKYLIEDLTSCTLCEWNCEVDRLESETGVCGITVPEVSSSQLHGAPPASFDAFLTGCSFRCLSCQNWTIANYPVNDYNEIIEGYYAPSSWAELALAALAKPEAKIMGADRLFFTGGEPTCSLPWVEAVVRAAKQIDTHALVNYDTNGFMTKSSLKRILKISDSITFDLKALSSRLFSALTGAEVEPVLRNAEHIARAAPEKIWEFRILLIPRLHEADLEDLCSFLADLNPELPVNFLAFRPNFIMDRHYWAERKLMENAIRTAEHAGLQNVSWSGRTKPRLYSQHPDESISEIQNYAKQLKLPENAALATAYAHAKGCIAETQRHCGNCRNMNNCAVKKYTTDIFY